MRITGVLITVRGRVFSYADDAMFYHQSRELEQVVGELQTQFDHIGNWCGEMEQWSTQLNHPSDYSL